MLQPGKRYRSFDDGLAEDAPTKRISGLSPSHEGSTNLSLTDSGMDLDLPDVTGDVADAARPYRILETEMICYGSLCNAHILVRSVTEKPNDSFPWVRYCSVSIDVEEGGCFLSIKNESKTNSRPVLDCHSAAILHVMADKMKEVSFTAIIGAGTFHAKRGKSSRRYPPVEATVNIYGPGNLMDEVGRILAEINVCLQHPVFLESTIPYMNPHYMYPRQHTADLRHLIGPVYKKPESNVSRVIEDIFGSLDHLDPEAPLTDYDENHLSNMLTPFLVDTQLKDHQLQGVNFILGQEDSYFVSQRHTRMLSSIHYSLLPYQHSTGRGGILADVMGLGKTLTMLSAIVCSKRIATPHAHIKDPNNNTGHESLRGQTTLIVLPSRQVLDVWENEINRRFHPQTFKVAIFHGGKRAKEGRLLQGNDVVLTTYQTLEKDNSRCKVLLSIKWARIILDEAHHVRNSSSKMFKAASALESETRWCVTGTPIQNSFDDLKSLLKFLRLEPFCQNKIFEDHIIKPFRQDQELGTNTGSRNLKILLKASCLRRTQTKLNLPDVTTQQVLVTPTTEEKAQFTEILEQCRKEFDKLAGEETPRKKPNVLFSTMMKLRRVCNHGVIPINPKSPGRLERLVVPKNRKNGHRSTFLGSPCDCNLQNEEDDFLFDGFDGCPLCGRIQVETIDETSSMASSPGVFSPLQPSSLTPHSMETSTSTVAALDYPFFRNELTVQSSKMSAVLDNIKTSCVEPNSKSVIFSSWRTTLDILARVLSENRIEFVQVDGRTQPNDRKDLLSVFCENPNVRVLLISMNTGAVGLTLTVANVVHIVEPQWNPAIEEQAMARVVRMGQTRPVTIFKYIMAKSVEQNVVKLQERKTHIIKLSMQDKDDSDSDATLESFKFAIDPTEWQ